MPNKSKLLMNKTQKCVIPATISMIYYIFLKKLYNNNIILKILFTIYYVINLAEVGNLGYLLLFYCIRNYSQNHSLTKC